MLFKDTLWLWCLLLLVVQRTCCNFVTMHFSCVSLQIKTLQSFVLGQPGARYNAIGLLLHVSIHTAV